MKVVTIDLVMYPAEVTFIMGCTLEEFKNKAKRIKQPCVFDVADYHSSYGLCFKGCSGLNPLIWLEAYPTDPKTIGYLVHEVSHAIFAISNELGNVNEEEFFCYASQYVVSQVLNAVT